MSHLNSAVSSVSDSNRFKRSASAVYKIDSAALRKWERNIMHNYKNNKERIFLFLIKSFIGFRIHLRGRIPCQILKKEIILILMIPIFFNQVPI